MRDIDRCHILLVEDNRAHQNLLLLALASGRPQVHVTVVATGEEFLRAVRQQRFDCIILDYRLPDGRAEELLAKAGNNVAESPVLIVSSSRSQEIVAASMRVGGVDFVPKHKAVRGEELWHRVERAVQEHRRQRLERRRRERRQRYFARLAETDQLTGLRNRHYLRRCLREGRWQKDRRLNCACMMFDIDNFKHVNDEFGHLSGDRVLRTIGRIIARNAKDSVAVRWGGEEFLILRYAEDLADAWAWCEDLREQVADSRIDLGHRTLQVTLSAGLIHCGSKPFDAEAINRADEALYLAKHLGRNRLCTADMVNVMREAHEVASLPERVADRRSRLIWRLGSALGPIQRSHVGDHCEQVAKVAAEIAALLELDDRTIDRIHLAGLLHDIGKSIVPESLLAKPRALSGEEWRIVAEHEEYGMRIARLLGADVPTLAFIRDHHRRVDDENSPCPAEPILAQMQDLQTGARVLCVADAVVTMLSHRPYRQARTPEAALHELRRERGRQFDPLVADAAQMLCWLNRPRAA
jgi:diguanylate cyclase (GGDEF)-like protein/putative nucleotidyltransferase with HDIG domain